MTMPMLPWKISNYQSIREQFLATSAVGNHEFNVWTHYVGLNLSTKNTLEDCLCKKYLTILSIAILFLRVLKLFVQIVSIKWEPILAKVYAINLEGLVGFGWMLNKFGLVCVKDLYWWLFHGGSLRNGYADPENSLVVDVKIQNK